MTVGQRIKEAREKVRVTQAELGEKIGVSGVAVMRYEKDQRQPRLEQLQAIASALNVAITDLLPDPTEEERAEVLQVIKEIGLPGGDATVAETRELIRRVSEVYGEKSAYLLKLTSIMREEGVDRVVEYTKSIFQEYMDEVVIPKARMEPPAGR